MYKHSGNLCLLKSIMSTTTKDAMVLRPDSSSDFASFPREIRDTVFSCIASAARVDIDYHDNYYLLPYEGADDFAECIELLHEWAPRSYIAKGACEEIWSSGTFNHGWYFESEIVIDPRATLFVRTIQGKTVLKESVGTPIDLRKCVREIRLYTNPNPYDLANPSEIDNASLLKLKQELSQLGQFPHLRRVQLGLWIPQTCDAYFEGMTIVESISDACKELRKRIGAGLNIILLRAWPYDIGKFEYMDDYDISWMWDTPTQGHRERVREGLATADERIGVLIADGVEQKGERTLLEELRDAGSLLPQLNEEIVKMEVWKRWTGIDESEWLRIKERWGRNGDDM